MFQDTARTESPTMSPGTRALGRRVLGFLLVPSAILAFVLVSTQAASGTEPSPAQVAAASDARVVLITGANRGLGLEFAKQFSEAGWTVFATAREPGKAEDLHKLGDRVHVLQLDVTDTASVAALAKSLDKQPIDLLINNAGVGVAIDGGPKLSDLKLADFDHVMQVNALGPVRMTQAVLPNLRLGKGKTIVNITSGLGSLAWNQQGGYYGYRESKAALDMFTRNLAAELKPEGFVCIALMPGWVKTDMGGPDAQLTPEQSITAMRKVIDQLKPADTGKLWNYDGTTPPW
jgi:NAD(P)-dependent dehydrogenase (short-subunit alcohol dehydrogenase family)